MREQLGSFACRGVSSVRLLATLGASQPNADAAARGRCLTAPTPLNTVGFSRRELDAFARAAARVALVEATDSQPSVLAIRVNGEPREIAAGATLAALVAELGLSGRKIAVAVNRDVVPRTAYAARALRAGDRVEILEAVGGG